MQLAVLAAAAFTYVTAEILPVGALPAIARDLHVSVPVVGTLLAWYAFVAALTTIPLVRWTAHWPRRRALLLSLACLTASQLISALAPNFVVLAGGRALSAVTHGLMLVGHRADRHPAGPGQPLRACDDVDLRRHQPGRGGGQPGDRGDEPVWGWRLAVAAVTAVAAVVTVAARAVLPALPLTDDQLAQSAAALGHHRNRRLVLVSLLTMVAVTGHYMSLHVHRRDHPRRRRRARTGPRLVAGHLRHRRTAGDAAGGPAARPSPTSRGRSAAWSALYVDLLVLTGLAFHRLPAWRRP